MKTTVNFTQADSAEESLSADALGRGPFVKSLAKTLVREVYGVDGLLSARRATGYVVGLTGEWGLGKSSVLNFVMEEFDGVDGVVVAKLNPWMFKGRDELVRAYFNSLREALGRSGKEQVRQLQGQLERYKSSLDVGGAAIAAAIDAYGLGGATLFWKNWLSKGLKAVAKPEELSADRERKSLEAKLAQEHIAVVVLIDELDRVDDEEVRAVAQLIKAIGDIKGISYLVAYDPKRVALALGTGSSMDDRQKSGEAYLEKIIQFSIPLRPLFDTDAELLLQASLERHELALPKPIAVYQSEIFDHLLRVLATPREIKRLVSAYSVLEEILRNEICPYDLLGYCWLIAKAPNLRSVMASKRQALVDDPDKDELVRRMLLQQENSKYHESVADVLGPISDAHKEMITLLFPRFRVDRAPRDNHPTGDRIHKRRNLIRLLYLGDPPGMLKKRDVEFLWSTPQADELTLKLSRLHADGHLEDFLDRLADLLPSLPRSGDHVFWIAISRTLTRPHDWMTSQETYARFVDDVSEILWRFTSSVADGKYHVKQIIDALIREGDLLIAPWILRKHLFAHGLTKYSTQGRPGTVFNLRETLKLQSTEILRYREALLDGTLLRRIPDTEAIYCIVNSAQWDAPLRSYMTSQLNNWPAISTFAALVVPPGVESSLENLDVMMDAKDVAGVIEILVLEGGLPKDEWLSESVNRLRATLKRSESAATDPVLESVEPDTDPTEES